jgi:hypothetical protein
MYLPDKGNGSQIIVSTQQFDIASLCTGQPHKVSEFRKFTADHSVCVFFKEVRNFIHVPLALPLKKHCCQNS